MKASKKEKKDKNKLDKKEKKKSEKGEKKPRGSSRSAAKAKGTKLSSFSISRDFPEINLPNQPTPLINTGKGDDLAALGLDPTLLDDPVVDVGSDEELDDAELAALNNYKKPAARKAASKVRFFVLLSLSSSPNSLLQKAGSNRDVVAAALAGEDVDVDVELTDADMNDAGLLGELRDLDGAPKSIAEQIRDVEEDIAESKRTVLEMKKEGLASEMKELIMHYKQQEAKLVELKVSSLALLVPA